MIEVERSIVNYQKSKKTDDIVLRVICSVKLDIKNMARFFTSIKIIGKENTLMLLKKIKIEQIK